MAVDRSLGWAEDQNTLDNFVFHRVIEGLVEEKCGEFSFIDVIPFFS